MIAYTKNCKTIITQLFYYKVIQLQTHGLYTILLETDYLSFSFVKKNSIALVISYTVGESGENWNRGELEHLLILTKIIIQSGSK